jgi:nitroreductase
MNFDEIVDNRRSARLFTNDDVSKKQLEKILSSGSLAPSARNRQPWKFYILSDTQKMIL